MIDPDRILAVVDALAPSLQQGGLDELELELGDMRVRLSRPRLATAQFGPPAAPAPAGSAGADAPPTHDSGSPFGEPSAGMRFVAAPLTGVWYPAPSPGARPYVNEGDEVTAGQVIGLIEAMKLFNEIKSDVSGTVTRVLVENGNLVKRKQPLLEIDPR